MAKRETPEISVIVTTFNSQQYIIEIINYIQKFLLNYTYEIVFVDDDSDDVTVRLIRNVMKENKRIKLITKIEHKGVSNSRNLGLDKASGKYVMFCDDDDELIGVLPKIKLNSDIISFSKNANSVHDKKENLISDIFGFHNTRSNYSGFNGGCYSKLFLRKNLLCNNIKFNEKLTDSEDVLFNIEAILRSNTINNIKQGIYKYKLREGSVTHKKNVYLFENHILFIKNLCRMFNEFNLNDTLLLKIKSLYLYQLIFRYFIYSPYYKSEYTKYYHQCFGVSNDRWCTRLNRTVEICTINIVNNLGIRAAIIFAKLYLKLKDRFKNKEKDVIL